MFAAIRKWVIQTMMRGQTGVVQTLPRKELIELNTQITAERIMRNGINPDDLKTVGQVENVVEQIDTPKVNVNPGMTSGKKADVMDMEGNKIDTSKGIMGGKEVPTSIDQESFLQRVNKAVQENRESDAAIKARLDAGNKKGIAGIKISLVDDSIAKIKSMEPMDAMKEANLVAGKKGRYSTLDDNQVKKIMEDTEDHIFERDVVPSEFDPEYAIGGRVGLFMGSKFPKGAASLREILKYFGKKSDVVKNPSDILRIVNPKQFNRMLEDPRIYGKFDVEKGIAAPDLIKDMQKKMTSNRQSTIKEMLGSAKNIKKSDDTTLRYKNEMIQEMMNKGASRKMAEQMADTVAKMAEGAAGKFNTPKLTEEGILQLENILKNMETGGKKARKLNADGGVAGLLGERPRYQTGGDVAFDASDASIYGSSAITVTPETVMDPSGNQIQKKMGNSYNPPLIEDVIEEKSALEDIKKQGIMQNEKISGNPNGVGVNDPNSLGAINEAYAKAQQDAKKQRADGFMGRIVLPGEMSFEDFSSQYKNKSLEPQKLPIATPDRPINQMPTLPTDIPFDGSGTKASIPSFQNLMDGYKSFASERYGDGNFASTADVRTYRLPDGTVQQGSSTSMGRINEYLKSIGQPPAKDVNSYSPLMQTALANGGRAGFAGGGMGRIGLKAGMTKRAFMKLMGGVGASIAAAKSGIFSGLGKGAGKTVAKEVAQQTTSSMPPPYFFKLAEKIKKMGKDVTSTSERTVSKSLKSKDGTADYVLEEDMVTGDVQIKKINMENDNMINDIEIMEYRTGENVMTKDGRVVTTPHEYDEVTESYSRIYKDDYNAPDYQDGIRVDEIIKEVDDTTPSIKYASGGLAYMLGE